MIRNGIEGVGFPIPFPHWGEETTIRAHDRFQPLDKGPGTNVLLIFLIRNN